jgi:hypothetical protein
MNESLKRKWEIKGSRAEGRYVERTEIHVRAVKGCRREGKILTWRGEGTHHKSHISLHLQRRRFRLTCLLRMYAPLELTSSSLLQMCCFCGHAASVLSRPHGETHSVLTELMGPVNKKTPYMFDTVWPTELIFPRKWLAVSHEQAWAHYNRIASYSFAEYPLHVEHKATCAVTSVTGLKMNVCHKMTDLKISGLKSSTL